MKIYDFKDSKLPESFFWFNEPKSLSIDNGLEVVTRSKTDFWQGTHYGFRRDDGHCLLTKLEGDFSISTKVSFTPVNQYDQCGMMIRLDSQNWIKCSTEYENEEVSRLGSVVTNMGYSDWATQDISSGIKSIYYKISRRGKDFLLENSFDGEKWQQMRVTHLHELNGTIEAGIYACSPIGEDFKCNFEYIKIDDNKWEIE
jgi:uncharacterized protein